MYYRVEEETLHILLTEKKSPIICCGLNTPDIPPAS